MLCVLERQGNVWLIVLLATGSPVVNGCNQSSIKRYKTMECIFNKSIRVPLFDVMLIAGAIRGDGDTQMVAWFVLVENGEAKTWEFLAEQKQERE